jgi:hypothetical protein
MRTNFTQSLRHREPVDLRCFRAPRFGNPYAILGQETFWGDENLAPFLKSQNFSRYLYTEAEMRSSDPHTLLLHCLYAMLGLGGYFLIMRSICLFLAFGEESDKFRSRPKYRTQGFARAKNQGLEVDHEQISVSRAGESKLPASTNQVTSFDCSDTVANTILSLHE